MTNPNALVILIIEFYQTFFILVLIIYIYIYIVYILLVLLTCSYFPFLSRMTALASLQFPLQNWMTLVSHWLALLSPLAPSLLATSLIGSLISPPSLLCSLSILTISLLYCSNLANLMSWKLPLFTISFFVFESLFEFMGGGSRQHWF